MHWESVIYLKKGVYLSQIEGNHHPLILPERLNLPPHFSLIVGKMKILENIQAIKTVPAEAPSYCCRTFELKADKSERADQFSSRKSLVLLYFVPVEIKFG